MKRTIGRIRQYLAPKVAVLLPARLKALPFYRLIRCSDPMSEKFVFKLAETREELEACFRLLHDAYVEAGFMEPAPSGLRVTVYHALPSTTTLLCRYGDRVVGTLSLIRDSEMGFPLQRVFDLAEVRKSGGNIAEVSALAIDRRFRSASGRIMLPLMKFMYEYATRQFDTRHLVIAVNPRHIGFYERMLCFRRLAQQPVEQYDFVNGASAVGAHLDLGSAPAILRQRYDHLPAEKNLYRYFTATRVPNFAMPKRRFFTTTDPVMTPQLIDHFFNERTQVFASLQPRDLLLLHSIYDLPEFKRCLPSVPDDTPRTEMRRRSHRRFPVQCPGDLKITQFGVARHFRLQVFECSASGFRVRAERVLPIGATGEVAIALGASDQSKMMVTVLRHGSRDQAVALVRIDQPDGAWLKFVRALAHAHTNGDLEDATRFV